MIRIMICALVVVVLSGCQGHCFSLDGTYKEWSGGFTWCLDSTQSDSAGRVVLQNETKQSATLINEAEAIAITEKLTANSGTVKASTVTSFAELNRLLKEILGNQNDKIKNQ